MIHALGLRVVATMVPADLPHLGLAQAEALGVGGAKALRVDSHTPVGGARAVDLDLDLVVVVVAVVGVTDAEALGVSSVWAAGLPATPVFATGLWELPQLEPALHLVRGLAAAPRGPGVVVMRTSAAAVRPHRVLRGAGGVVGIAGGDRPELVGLDRRQPGAACTLRPPSDLAS